MSADIARASGRLSHSGIILHYTNLLLFPVKSSLMQVAARCYLACSRRGGTRELLKSDEMIIGGLRKRAYIPPHEEAVQYMVLKQ